MQSATDLNEAPPVGMPQHGSPITAELFDAFKALQSKPEAAGLAL